MIRKLITWLFGQPRPGSDDDTGHRDTQSRDPDPAGASDTTSTTRRERRDGRSERSGRARSDGRGGEAPGHDGRNRPRGRPRDEHRTPQSAPGPRRQPRNVARSEPDDGRPPRITHPAARLGLNPDHVSPAAMKTCEGLQDAGFEAYVVGGGVRDSLLGIPPKDFDVATNATPAEVQRVFRRSRLIGRRFQIVHVLFGRETIEVTTFRAAQTDATTDEHGRVLRDNQFGTQREDALRRDFTVNALYYDPVEDVVIDYLDGVRDLHARRLRMIGDPEARYREDPVRMLRTIRFASKLDFAVDPPTLEPVRRLADLLRNVPSARLFDEIMKLLMSGRALEAMRRLKAEGLHHGVLPVLDTITDDERGFIHLALEQTDRRVQQGKSISPSFLFASLLWPQVRERWQAARDAGELPHPALTAAMDSVLAQQAESLAIQRRYQADMHEIWSMQPRLERRSRAAHKLLEHLRFRAGYDFLLLRCDSGEVDPAIGQWWTEFIDADGPRRDELLRQASGQGPAASPRKRRSRSRREGGNDTQARTDDDDVRDGGARDGQARGVVNAGPDVDGTVREPAGTPETGAEPGATNPAPQALAAAPRKVTAYVGLGANLGDAPRTLRLAADALDDIPDTQVTGRSSIYRSTPVEADGPDFLNQVVELRTRLGARELLEALQSIEQQFGRERGERNAPRTLDLDLLLHGRRRMRDDDLTIPHPRMHQRLFVLMPLLELSPDLRIPGRHRASDHLRDVLDAGQQRCEPIEPSATADPHPLQTSP